MVISELGVACVRLSLDLQVLGGQVVRLVRNDAALRYRNLCGRIGGHDGIWLVGSA